MNEGFHRCNICGTELVVSKTTPVTAVHPVHHGCENSGVTLTADQKDEWNQRNPDPGPDLHAGATGNPFLRRPGQDVEVEEVKVDTGPVEIEKPTLTLGEGPQVPPQE